MRRNEHKRFTGTNCFTDFKHHAKSWHNSKRLRSRMIRRKLKYKAESEDAEYNPHSYKGGNEINETIS